MMNDDERVHESSENAGGAPGDGPKKKRRRRRRGRGRDAQDGAPGENVGEGNGGMDDDGDDDAASEARQQRQPAGRNREKARDGMVAHENGSTGEPIGDDAETRERRKRRRKRKRSSDAPEAERREQGSPEASTETGEKPAQQDRRQRSGDRDRPADQERRHRNEDRSADHERRHTSDDDDRPADDNETADERLDDRDRRDGRRRSKSRGREQRERRDAAPKGPSVLQRRLVRIDGPREDLLAEPVIPVATQVQASSVEGYIQHHKGWQREVLMRLRDILRAAAPDAVESIKWSQPVFELEGPMCYFKAFSNHINFGFWRGAELNDPDHLLEGDGLKMRHIRITAVNDINLAAYESLVRHAVKLNLEKGDPTA